jgi:hypothetical protein
MNDTQTCHFWLGNFPSEERASNYLCEVWDEDDEDRDHTPLSEFARDQGEKWYDHDFLEHGFRPKAKSVADLVKGHSYFEQYTDELTTRATALGLANLNTLIFIEQDQIDSPRSVTTSDFSLHYLGTITYRI